MLYLLLLLVSSLFCSLNAYEYEVAIGAIFQNEAPYLKEWVDYHYQIGVEHFWLYDDMSGDDWRSELQSYMERGIVEVKDWSACRNKIQQWPQIQVEAYKDALKNASGVSKWLAMIDTDEFLLPMKENNIRECLENHFSQADAIYVSWLVFGTSGVTLRSEESMLEHLTHCTKSHPWNKVGKTILQPEKASIEKVWYVHHCPLKEGYCYTDGNARAMPWSKNGTSNEPEIKSHCDEYIRINHYFFRDEYYYQHVKTPRKLKRGMSLASLNQLYEASKVDKDEVIIELLHSLKRQNQLLYR